ncbi:MAG: protein kinase [Acidobacteria bacterium]|nr:protein kinase [Acidobacteriota bacterium]
MDLQPGTRMGPYEIVAPLGAGGMGEVYRARDPRLGREVALKVLPGAFAGDPDRQRRFEQEAQATGRLNHPNLLSVFDVGEHAGQPYLVAELLEGQSLRQLLDRGALPLRTALDYAGQIAGGLAAAHGRGVVHRDLKPANLFVTSDGRVKILDFGLAKLSPQEARDDLAAATTAGVATETGVLIGSIGYMSPEQLRGLPADARADIFAFGVILFEMLAGRHPFARASAVETMSAVLHQEAPGLASLVPDLPPALDRIVHHCLEKNPADRFHSVHDLALQLDDAAAPEPPSRPRPAARRSKAIDSVAVLPFHNVGGDAETEYLSDGITESILHTLSQLPKLRVMARSTVFRYKGRHDDALAVGRELGVRAVLAGRLMQRRDALAVQAELVDVSDGSLLWGARYDKRSADLLAVHDEIAAEISDRLRFKLTGAERRKLRRPLTQDSAAYQAYLKGRFFWNKWTPEGMRVSLGFYQQAIEIDPRYALAWAGLADSHAVLGNIKAVPPAEAFPRAKAAALKALEIDPDLAEAHASLGFVRRFFDWDWPGAERSFVRAVRLNPSYATAHRFYAQFLSGSGRHDEAVSEAELAIELEPLSIIIHTAVGDVLFYARRYDEAIGYYRRALVLDPDFLPGHSDLARALELSGRIDEAIAEYEKAIRLAQGENADPSAGLANAYAVAGRRADALAVLEELQRRRAAKYVSPWALASIYARLGEDGAALDWLDRAYDEHDSTLVWVKVHPRFDHLRAHPRYQDLLRRMGLG